ncbi:AI-2E family transporter [Humibacillus xanthopallidus]|uniref:AI-2E family transporter n=1 Tax=Humibacillus xanthopallidus TaxID=412689 RepID=UPI00384FCD8A
MTGPAMEPPPSPPPTSAPGPSAAPAGSIAPPGATDVVIHLDRANVWRTGWVLVGVVALAALANFVISDGGSVIFTLIMSMLAAIAMEPAVARLSQRMRRGVATMIVMLGVLVFIIIFLLAFGRLLGEQLATFVKSVPALVESGVTWANETFGTSLSVQSLLDQFTGGTSGLTALAGDLAGGLIGVVAAVLGAFFSSITFFFFTYYLSADSPRLRMWVARLAPPKQQEVFGVAWDLAVIKTGGYVSARLVLAAICGGLSSLFMLIIGMPYWLALGIWTGLVAQFVPTIGTYIAIALPVFVGLVGPEPWQGLALLAFALVYQQIENVTIEPRISAEAVDVHPAVSFAAVMFGAALFGVAGAFVAVPVAALMLALFGIYSKKYDLVPELASLQAAQPDSSEAEAAPGAAGGSVSDDKARPAAAEGA